MKRGEIYFVISNYREEGSEQRGDRPAVIVSNDMCNDSSEVVEIVYMTTQPKSDLPTHVYIRSARYPSTLLCEQVHSVSKLRIGELIGKLTDEEMKALDAALAISLGLDFGAAPVMREPTKEELEKLVEGMRTTPLRILYRNRLPRASSWRQSATFTRNSARICWKFSKE